MQKLISFSKEPINFSQELMGGLANFLAIAYIIIVNPIILNASGKAFPIIPSITATILTIVIMTTLAGLIIKLPFVIAPGMGMNAIVSYTLIISDNLSPEIALGVVFWSSLLLFIFSITPLRQKIINAIPIIIQIALSVGIGLFLIFIGIKNVNLVVANPNTLLSINKIDSHILLCFLGLVIATYLFIHKKVYSLILPIIIITVLNIFLNHKPLPQNIFTMPDFSLFMHINLVDSLKFSIIPAILSLFLVNFFDATATVIGLLSQIGYKDIETKKIYYKKSLISDAISGMVSSLIGTSPGVIFVESSAAIQTGAKTGLSAICTAIFCIPFLFLSPIISLIPNSATSPILILVGIIMMNNIRKINLSNLEDLIAVVLTIIMMPLCFSITAGAVFGILSYTILKIILGKWEQLSISLIIVALFCISWFIII
ncbi:MAG TPA: NCS2 family permease [Burkholderiales bacterium]|nr:NCS2 family permease [Burkholderiales bacterium]